ncbi:MAG: S8 family peptidase [Bacteroidetes bacterium]|nr:S8 family peptidase [Bacteroidota bacterium]
MKKTALAFLAGLMCISALIAQTKIGTYSVQSHFKLADNLKEGDYLEKTIIIKVLPAYSSICSAANIDNTMFKKLFSELGGMNLSKVFPYTKAPESSYNERGEKLTDLTKIYQFNYTSFVSLEKAINKIAGCGIFEYAEPHYIPKIDYSPNDPLLSSQYAITKIQAENAWGVNTTAARGDTNVVVGITDTGTELTHSDLAGQIKINIDDLPGGGDNDGDGYTDNYRGWDLGDNDNDPTWTGNQHGVHVSGIACAKVDNSNGIAGVGFNCKYLPVKIANTAGTLTMAYEGITYAADHGCSIINCSWGGSGGGQFGQDVISYATINRNALVVAAAGNGGIDEATYPAAYTYVISVVNTNTTDHRDASSSFNYTADVCAPGTGINSTYPVNSYASLTGTSMASPCAAGAAAIIKSFFPSYTALQVGERLKVTSDNIYALHSPIYADKLGTGRINLFRALTLANSPSVVMTSRTVIDGNDNTFVANDTLKITGNYTNYLAPTTNLIATLTSSSPFVSVVSGTTTLGPVGTLAVANNNTDPFKVRILATAPLNSNILFKITYTDAATSYSANEYFYVTVNVDYVNITINDVATSIASNGRIGYSQNGQAGGLGFNYLGAGTLLYEAGLMIGRDTGSVSDCVRAYTTPAADFSSLVSAHAVAPSVLSEFDVEGKFKDNLATTPLPVTVHHQAFAWSTAGNRKYVIVQYTIANTGGVSLSSLYAGIFADWDIDAATFGSNRAAFDAGTKMGYCYYSGALGKYAGIKLLTSTAPVVHYAIDNIAGGGGGSDLTNGFNGAEKYLSLSTNRPTAGVAGAGNDVCDVVSTGPYTIAAGDSVKVAFALIAGDDLSDLIVSAGNAQVMYDGLSVATAAASLSIDNENSMSVFPNPTNGQSFVDLTISESAKIDLRVYNMLGEQISVIATEQLQPGAHRFVYETNTLSSGLYYYKLKIGDKKYVQKLIVTK